MDIGDGVEFVRDILDDMMTLNAKILDYKYKTSLSVNVLEF